MISPTLKHLVGLAALSASTLTLTLAGSAQAADTCPNASLRAQNNSTNLPDCRAYELVTPDLNHAKLYLTTGLTAPDGDAVTFSTFDAPDNAVSGIGGGNTVRGRRDPVMGWSTSSLAPPVPGPVDRYLSFSIFGVASDLATTVVVSSQSLAPGTDRSGNSLFVGRPDGTYRLLTPTASVDYPRFVAGNGDFSHVYFTAAVPQLPSDPVSGGNTYSWTEAGGLSLVGVLPNGTIAPNGAVLASDGAVLPPTSADGSHALFVADDALYLHTDDAPSVEIAAHAHSVGITPDGTTALFTSSDELTGDANTGPANQGNDLYSYDVETGHITDLSVDSNPADAATGANVRRVVASTPDGSYVYFVASGTLAAGASPGHVSLYVWHHGSVQFVSTADGSLGQGNGGAVAVTPDGQSVLFSATDQLTAYDNTDPVTGQPHREIYKATLGQAIECVSCRSDGTRPTADTEAPPGAMSSDGRRVFFDSTDPLVPQALSARRQVYEYESGKLTLISRPGASSDALFVAADPAGQNVFFSTFDDLVPNPNSGDNLLFDARVGGGFSNSPGTRCAGPACQAAPSPPPVLAPAASIDVSGIGNASSVTESTPKKLSVSQSRTFKGSSGSLRVKVPGRGRLRVTGSGLLPVSRSLQKARTITVRLALSRHAARTIKKKFNTKVRVAFTDSGRRTTTTVLSVTFKAAATRRAQ